MLSLNYQYEAFADVPKPAELFRDMGNNSESAKVRNMYNAAKSIFGVNSVTLNIAKESRIYKYIITVDISGKKYSVGNIIYIPEERRLDIWSIDDSSGSPLIQYQGKRIMHKNYSKFYDSLGIDKLFNLLVANL